MEAHRLCDRLEYTLIGMFIRNLEGGLEFATIGNSALSFVSRHADRRIRAAGM